MNKKIAEIAKRLPSNLSEEAVIEIAKAMDEIIAEEVKSGFKILTAKVKSFLRTQIDEIKEQAIAELTEENELYRNAKLFEEVRSLMALEVTPKDLNNAVTKSVTESTEMVNEVTKDNKFLLKQLKEASAMIAELEEKHMKLRKKNRYLEQKQSELLESNVELTHKASLEVKSTEKAIMVSEADSPVKTKTNNGFLTEDVMALMPQVK